MRISDWSSDVCSSDLVDLVQVLRKRGAEATPPVDEGIALGQLRFRYVISGDAPAWRPLRAFDDGDKVYIQFPANIGQGELPPLFVIGAEGDVQLVKIGRASCGDRGCQYV